MKPPIKPPGVAPTVPTMPVAGQGGFVCVFDNAGHEGDAPLLSAIEKTETVVTDGSSDDLQAQVRVAQNAKYFDDALAYFRTKAIWGLARGWLPMGVSEAVEMAGRRARAHGLSGADTVDFMSVIADGMVASEMEISLRSDGLFTGIEMMIENGHLAVGATNASQRVRLYFSQFRSRTMPTGYQFIGLLNAQQKKVFREWFAQERYEEMRRERNAFMERTDADEAAGPIHAMLRARGYYLGPLHRLRIWEDMPQQFIGTDRSMAHVLLLEGGLKTIHAYINQTEGRWHVVAGSSGCLMDALVCGRWMPIPGRCAIEIEHGDIIRIGAYEFRVEKVTV